jgi:hypothetical protein
MNPVGGSYYPTSTQTVTLTCASSGANIHYTTNGVDPTTGDPYVTSGGTVIVSQSLTLKARGFKSGLAPSNVNAQTYTLNVYAPVFSPVQGTYNTSQNVTMTSSTSGATIRYTTDGSTPTESSTQYTGPVAVTSTTTLKAAAFKGADVEHGDSGRLHDEGGDADADAGLGGVHGLAERDRVDGYLGSGAALHDQRGGADGVESGGGVWQHGERR